MTEQEYLRFKEHYECLMKSKQILLNEQEELEKLKEMPDVKRYLELVHKLDDYDNQDFMKMDERKIVSKAYSLAQIKNTKKYYYLTGYFKDKYDCDIVHGTGMTRCGRNDPEAIYAVYNSLETGSSYYVESEEIVPMSKVNEFENNHVILISSKSIYFEKEEFWMDIINLGYEKACERLVDKSKKYFD